MVSCSGASPSRRESEEKSLFLRFTGCPRCSSGPLEKDNKGSKGAKMAGNSRLPRREARHTFRGRHGGGGKKRGGGKPSRMTPLPKRGFGPPLVRYVFHPPQVSPLCFSCTKIHDRADQKLVWRGPKMFGRAHSLVRFPPPIRFAPPPISRPNTLRLKPPLVVAPFRSQKNSTSTVLKGRNVTKS